MFPVILAIPVAFGIGAIIALLIMLRRRELCWRFFVAASEVYVGYFVVLLGLPFWNFAGEALVVPQLWSCR